MQFEITEDHIKLLRAAEVRWEDCETGAPAIDCKRPYGNSWVWGDVAEILGWPIDDEGLTDEQEDEARRLHQETETVLEIVLKLGYLKPGRYAAEYVGYRRTWREEV
jgi:hypothetical protein